MFFHRASPAPVCALLWQLAILPQMEGRDGTEEGGGDGTENNPEPKNTGWQWGPPRSRGRWRRADGLIHPRDVRWSEESTLRLADE